MNQEQKSLWEAIGLSEEECDKVCALLMEPVISICDAWEKNDEYPDLELLFNLVQASNFSEKQKFFAIQSITLTLSEHGLIE